MKIVLVDDSMLVRAMLKSFLSEIEDFEVIGEAGNGKQGIEVVKTLSPDLLLMDVNMPEMDGIKATEILMKEYPLPIVILTSEDIASVGYKALNRGAVEIVPKPDIHQMNDPEFQKKLQGILIHAAKFRKSSNRTPSALQNSSSLPIQNKSRILLIGASTGGPSAVRTVLSSLPADFPLPVLLSQHIEVGFDRGYAEWLNESSPLSVRIAEESNPLEAGVVLVAPATRHLLCTESHALCDDGPRVDNQKPSVDKMFKSGAQAFSSSVLAVLLTGMGRDGAQGCLEIVNKGGTTLVQDKDSSMIYGMPKAAIDLNAASQVLSLDDMASGILGRVGLLD